MEETTTPRLDYSFFYRDCETVCREILGHRLVRVFEDGSRISGKIVEVEAYLGIDDAACHAYQGKKTKENASMYLSPGYSYVYQRFKKLHCFNISTNSEGNPAALLIRGLEPVEGIEIMIKNRMRGREKCLLDHQICSGPAKVAQALQIDLSHDGIDLITSEIIFVEQDSSVDPSEIVADPRVRIDYAGEEAAKQPLRFSVKNNKFVSLPPKTRQPQKK